MRKWHRIPYDDSYVGAGRLRPLNEQHRRTDGRRRKCDAAFAAAVVVVAVAPVAVAVAASTPLPNPAPPASAPSVIQEPFRTSVIPSVSERIHNSTTAQKLKTGKGLEFLVEESKKDPVVPPAPSSTDDINIKNNVSSVHSVVQPPPAHTKITIEAKQPAIQTSVVQPLPPAQEKASPVSTSAVPSPQPVARVTHTPDSMHHPHLSHFGRDIEQNVHLSPEFLASQRFSHAPSATPPPSASIGQMIASPHLPPHLRPIMPPHVSGIHPDHLPYGMPAGFMFHPSYAMNLPPHHMAARLSHPFTIPTSLSQKEMIRPPLDKEQELKTRARLVSDESQAEQQHPDYLADEEAFKRSAPMIPGQMRGLPYHPTRLPHHLLSPHERVADSPAHMYQYHQRHMLPTPVDPKSGNAPDFMPSPVPKPETERKPAHLTAATAPEISRPFGMPSIASPAPGFLDARTVHQAAHSPGSHVFRTGVPQSMTQREEELRKLHISYASKDMSSPGNMNLPTGTGYHMPGLQHHIQSDQHPDNTVLNRTHPAMGSEAPHASRHLSQPPLHPETPPHASQVPASGESILLQRYPVVWQGLLALKNDQAAVQMHFISGSRKIANSSLPPVLPDTGPSPVRISQRMRLEQTQLEGVARKMQVSVLSFRNRISYLTDNHFLRFADGRRTLHPVGPTLWSGPHGRLAAVK